MSSSGGGLLSTTLHHTTSTARPDAQFTIASDSEEVSAMVDIPDRVCSRLGCTDAGTVRVRLDDGRERVTCDDHASGQEVLTDV